MVSKESYCYKWNTNLLKVGNLKNLFERICRHITRQNLFSNVTSFISINVHYCQVCGTFQILTRTSPELLYALHNEIRMSLFCCFFSDVNFVFNPTIPFYTFNFWIHNKNITTKAEEIQVQNTLLFAHVSVDTTKWYEFSKQMASL